jgi:CheY-like chemotaxis protein
LTWRLGHSTFPAQAPVGFPRQYKGRFVGIKILLADDSVTAQNMGKKILSEAGHDVVTVSNGAAAAKKIAEVKPELVLLDVFMPGYSGLELCERLRNAAETAKLPVLLTVGRMEPYSPQDGARVKADGVIVKPFEATDLTAAVERFAQKSKAAKQQGDYERTIKIAAPPGSRDDTSRESQKIAAAASEPRAYEQTMRLDAAQIAALLNTGGAKTEKPAPAVPEQEFSVPAAAHAADEFRIQPPPTAEMPAADPGAPVLGNDLLPEPHAKESQQAAIPSYMAQYLDQPAHDADTAVTARPSVGPSAEFDPEKTTIIPPRESAPSPAAEFPAHEQFSPTIPISDQLVPHRFHGDLTPAPVASAQGLELTAAAPVPDVPVAQESGLETTLQSGDAPTIVLKDPALVTDPHRATMDFPTQFGTSEPPAADLTVPAEPVTAPVDEFEARLQAAMSSYEESSTDLPLPSLTETPADLHHGLVSELPSPPTGAAATFEEPDEPFFATAPIGSTDLALPEPVQLTEEAHGLVPSNVVEFPSAAIEPAAAIETPHYESVVEETKPEIVADAADAVSISAQPVDSSDAVERAEVVSMTMAAAAAASAPVVAPQHPNYEAETELARALQAAVEAEGGTDSVSLAPEDLEQAPSGQDANRVAAAVEKVMQRELPGLIWKIMAELDLRKR